MKKSEKKMLVFTKGKIKEIAEQLELGFRCFVHRQTGEIISIPDTLKNHYIDPESWEEEQEKLDNNFLT